MTSGRTISEYVADIRNAAKLLQRITRSRRWVFMYSAILRAAAERQIEIIGEAAYEITQLQMPMIKSSDPELDKILRLAYKMRNKLIHAYDKVDPAIVWEAASVSAPALASDVERYLLSILQEQQDLTLSSAISGVPSNPFPGLSPDPPETVGKNRVLCGVTTDTGGICTHLAPRFKRKCPAGHKRKRRRQ